MTPKQAIELLPEGKYIHTYINPAVNLLMGNEYSREAIIQKLENSADDIQITGKMARSMKHGIAIDGKFYIETNMELLDQKYPELEE